MKAQSWVRVHTLKRQGYKVFAEMPADDNDLTGSWPVGTVCETAGILRMHISSG